MTVNTLRLENIRQEIDDDGPEHHMVSEGYVDSAVILISTYGITV